MYTYSSVPPLVDIDHILFQCQELKNRCRISRFRNLFCSLRLKTVMVKFVHSQLFTLINCNGTIFCVWHTLRCCGNLSAMKVRVVPECMYKRCYKPFLSISMAYYVIWNMYGKRGYRVSKAELRTAKVDPYSRREKITFGGVPKSNTDTIFKIKTSHWLSGIFINIKYRSFNG